MLLTGKAPCGMWIGYLLVTCQAAMVFTFVAAAGSKVLRAGALAAFRDALPRMIFLPKRFSWSVAWLVVVAEMATAVIVAVPGLAMVGFLLAMGLMLIFTLSIASMVRRGSVEPCRCFGVSTRPPGWIDVIRNLALIAVAGAGLAGTAGSANVADIGVGGLALATGVGAVIALLLMNLGEIADLMSPARVPDRQASITLGIPEKS
ncbi:MauE/DoxX family redox-associated membrane protein [Micromonospora sp. NPDC048842]|uniref:MauE/DoxX family redox-associated membrane protein n=1 Tax=Micromonospora sp. NPDC048842 TaxID=3154346 RepID=UPI0033EAAB0C